MHFLCVHIWKIYTIYIFYLTLTCLIILFCSPDPKGQVRYCHRLASIKFTLKIFFSETIGPIGNKLVRSFLLVVL